MASSSCSLDLDLMQIEILHHHYYCEITPTAFIKGQCRDVVGFRKEVTLFFAKHVIWHSFHMVVNSARA